MAWSSWKSNRSDLPAIAGLFMHSRRRSRAPRSSAGFPQPKIATLTAVCITPGTLSRGERVQVNRAHWRGTRRLGGGHTRETLTSAQAASCFNCMYKSSSISSETVDRRRRCLDDAEKSKAAVTCVSSWSRIMRTMTSSTESLARRATARMKPRSSRSSWTASATRRRAAFAAAG